MRLALPCPCQPTWTQQGSRNTQRVHTTRSMTSTLEQSTHLDLSQGLCQPTGRLRTDGTQACIQRVGTSCPPGRWVWVKWPGNNATVTRFKSSSNGNRLCLPTSMVVRRRRHRSVVGPHARQSPQPDQRQKARGRTGGVPTDRVPINSRLAGVTPAPPPARPPWRGRYAG